MFAEKANEWWALPPNDQAIFSKRIYLLARSHRLGQDLERLINMDTRFQQAIPMLGALRDAATLGPFDDNARPIDLTRSVVLLERANNLRAKLRQILDARF